MRSGHTLTASLTREGQLTLPDEVREELDLQPFDRFDVEVVDKEIRLRKRLLDLWELEGIVPALDPPMDPDEAIRIAKQERAKRWRENNE